MKALQTIATFIILFLNIHFLHCQIENTSIEVLQNQYAQNLLERNYPQSQGYSYGQDHTLHHPDHDFTLGSIQVDILKNSLGDFNQDGIKDYWGSVIDEGLGGGGNAFGYEIGIFQLSKTDEFIFISYFEGGKFSDIHYTLDGHKNEIPIIGVTPNFQGSYGLSIEKSETVAIAFENGEIISKSYENNCQMAQMKNKSIFKDTLLNVQKKETLSEFLEVQQQETYIDNTITYQADISGCNDFFLNFYANTKTEMKEERFIQIVFDFLNTHTRFSSIVKKIKQQYLNTGISTDTNYSVTKSGWYYNIKSYTSEGNTYVSIKYYHKN
ncbi:hypothetical protein [Aquimarina aquimarini]|uniref:hypothetical protein n=1 Tax=Aquimarina aquimarini TaxID=1191734 RepID=UPI000D55EC36|nr:hypothetical protein [Aquimarina aquimarini]